MKLDLKLMEKRVRDMLDDQTHLYGITSHVSNQRNQLDVSIDRPGGMSLEDCSLLHREFYNSEFYEDYENYDVTFGTPGLSRKCIFPTDFVFHQDKKFELTTLEGMCLVGMVKIIDANKQVLEITGKLKNAKSKDPEETHSIQWSNVKKAHFHLEF